MQKWICHLHAPPPPSANVNFLRYERAWRKQAMRITNRQRYRYWNVREQRCKGWNAKSCIALKSNTLPFWMATETHKRFQGGGERWRGWLQKALRKQWRFEEPGGVRSLGWKLWGHREHKTKTRRMIYYFILSDMERCEINIGSFWPENVHTSKLKRDIGLQVKI